MGLTLGGGFGSLSYCSLFCYLIIKMCVTGLPEHRAGLAEQDPVNPHSGLNRRTCAWAVESRFPPPPVLWMSCCGPASSLPNQYTCSITKYIKMNRHSVLQRCYLRRMVIVKLTRDFENCRPVSFDKKSTKFNTGKWKSWRAVKSLICIIFCWDES